MSLATSIKPTVPPLQSSSKSRTTNEVSSREPPLVASLNFTCDPATPSSLPTWVTRALCASAIAGTASASMDAAMVRLRFI